MILIVIDFNLRIGPPHVQIPGYAPERNSTENEDLRQGKNPILPGTD